MKLKPGTRLESQTGDGTFIVVRAPGEEIDLRCGGHPLSEAGTRGERMPITLSGDASLLGKRYADEDLGLELLCTKAGSGALTVGDTPLLIKSAKPLPASD